MPTGKERSFRATLERGDARLGWTVARIPFDVAKVWGSRGQVRVKGEINGFAFRTSLFPRGDGQHFLLVNKGMQKAAGVALGSMAKFRLQRDTATRTIPMPREMERALAEDRALRRWFDQLPRSMRNEIAKWIAAAKQAPTRARRAQQMAERLLATMEAERDLPPILQAAFARNPAARAGWERMGQAHRRQHLLGIFYYRTPEARARRAAKAIAEAEEYAKKAAGRAAGSSNPAGE